MVISDSKWCLCSFFRAVLTSFRSTASQFHCRFPVIWCIMWMLWPPEVNCGPPPAAPHSLRLWDQSSRLGSRAIYQCNSGYHNVGKGNVSKCNAAGEWEGPPLLCKGTLTDSLISGCLRLVPTVALKDKSQQHFRKHKYTKTLKVYFCFGKYSCVFWYFVLFWNVCFYFNYVFFFWYIFFCFVIFFVFCEIFLCFLKCSFFCLNLYSHHTLQYYK